MLYKRKMYTVMCSLLLNMEENENELAYDGDF